jgi:AraC-like DNA-binding protein
MLDQLAAAVARHSPGPWTATAVPRLTVVAVDEPIPAMDVLYDPMICFIAAGAKQTVAGERSWVAGGGQMFLNSLDVPVTIDFVRVPYRSAVLQVDGPMLAGLLLELDEADPRTLADPGGQRTAAMTPELIEAVTRWVRLLDTPHDIGTLAGRTEEEILYRLLRSPLGPVLRQFTVADSGLARVRAAAAWIRAHYNRPLRIETIAAVAAMSVATLHRQFKAATGMSPIGFQKSLRLQEARRMLVAGDLSAGHVAEAVGYTSPTQFSREYKRVYGLPPAQDAARLRRHLLGTH